MQFGLAEPLRQPVFSRDSLQSLGRAQRRQGVAAPDFEIRFPEEHIGDPSDVADLGRAPGRRLDQFARAFDLAQLPHDHGEDCRCPGAIVAKTIPNLRVGVRVASGEPPLVVGSRLNKVSLPVSDQAEPKIGDAGFFDPSGILRFAQERRGRLSYRTQFASCARRCPLTLQRGETL